MARRQKSDKIVLKTAEAPVMNALPRHRMTVEEYLAWSEGQERGYELMDGKVTAQAAERAAHAEMKGLVFLALATALKRQGGAYRALVDGMAVRVGERTVFEPDVLVYCGPRLPADALLVENPLILVEVVSPATSRYDHTRKLAGYFSLPSVRHYLIVDPDERLVAHHERRDDGVIVTHILTQGAARLDPPGIDLALADLYPQAEEA
jgi:Uma2 family endonuclease